MAEQDLKGFWAGLSWDMCGNGLGFCGGLCVGTL